VSVSGALSRLAALRCEGVAAEQHYSLGASKPDLATEALIFYSFASSEGWEFEPEDYDAGAATLQMGVVATLVIEPYRGRGQPGAVASLPMWIQRLMDMLASDLLLDDNLARPMSGRLRKAGVLDGSQLRYLGLVIDLNLLIRIEAS